MAKTNLSSAEPVRWWIVAPVVALVLAFAPAPPWVVEEFYSRDFYPFLQSALTAVSNVLPIAFLDLMIVAAALLVGYRIVRLFMGARRGSLLDVLWESVRRTIRLVGVVVSLFVLTWGCNYRRQPLETTLAGGQAVRPTAENLDVAIADANALAASLRGTAVPHGELTYEDVATQLEEPMNAALTELNRMPLKRPGRPKYSVIVTPFFTWAGVNGMINPLALESIVHPDLLPFERPFVLAHEWAHLAGQADEAEASAVGWLACMNGGSPLAYSASLYLIMEAAAALPADVQRRALSRLDVGVRSDLDAISHRMQKENPEVARNASLVYDQYLRANRVSDGTASYRRALSLILSEPLRTALSEYRSRRRAN